MVKNINIERECQHKILIKQNLVLIITATEFINDINEYDKKTKFAATNVSVINDNDGAQLSKIGGHGDTIEEAYKNCIDAFNKNKHFYEEENKILLCCSEIPFVEVDDLKDFNMTRLIKFSWTNKEDDCLLRAYVRSEKEKLVYLFEGDNRCRTAQTDLEIIEFILSNYKFDKQPESINHRCRGKLFYPTTEEFNR